MAGPGHSVPSPASPACCCKVGRPVFSVLIFSSVFEGCVCHRDSVLHQELTNRCSEYRHRSGLGREYKSSFRCGSVLGAYSVDVIVVPPSPPVNRISAAIRCHPRERLNPFNDWVLWDRLYGCL